MPTSTFYPNNPTPTRVKNVEALLDAATQSLTDATLITKNAVINVQSSANQAAASATNALQSAQNASQVVANINTAVNNAVAAKTAAEGFKNQAQQAQAAADASNSTVTTSLGTAITKAQEAAGSATAAANAKTAAETARDVAQGYRDAAQTAAASASLGFTPIQQGGGGGQLTTKVYLGSDGTGLKAQIGTTDLGRLWSDLAAAKSFSGSGYQKLPSGLIIQWLRFTLTGTADSTPTWPIAFPNNVLAVVASLETNDANANALYGVRTDTPTATACFVRVRVAANGGSVLPVNGQIVNIIAIGA